MKPIYFIRPKGVATALFGLLFIVTPAWVMTLMGAEIGAAGVVMMRLFGLALLVVGYGMATTSADAEISSLEALLTSMGDAVAVYFLIIATQTGVFNVLGYVLAAIYVVSSLGFLGCFLVATRVHGQKEAS